MTEASETKWWICCSIKFLVKWTMCLSCLLKKPKGLVGQPTTGYMNKTFDYLFSRNFWFIKRITKFYLHTHSSNSFRSVICSSICQINFPGENFNLCMQSPNLKYMNQSFKFVFFFKDLFILNGFNPTDRLQKIKWLRNRTILSIKLS